MPFKVPLQYSVWGLAGRQSPQDMKSVLLHPPAWFPVVSFSPWFPSHTLKNVDSFSAGLRYKRYAYILGRKNKEKKSIYSLSMMNVHFNVSILGQGVVQA